MPTYTHVFQNEEDEDSGIHMSTSPSSTFRQTQTNNTRNHRNALEKHMMFFNKSTASTRNADFLQYIRASSRAIGLPRKVSDQ